MQRKLDEQQVAVARVYASALLDLARGQGLEELMLEELRAMAEQFDRQPLFESLLGDPGVDEAERGEILERVLRGRAHDLVVNTLQVMNRKGRGGLFRALIQAYVQELEKLQGIVEATATTAVELSKENREKLIELIARRTGKKVLLNESVDESLLGGMVLRLGDQKIDSSIARELWRVGTRLDQRGSEELLKMTATATKA